MPANANRRVSPHIKPHTMINPETQTKRSNKLKSKSQIIINNGTSTANYIFLHPPPLYLRALSVHDGGPALVVLLLLDPHLLERGQRGQDGASDPHRVLALRRGDDLNGHRVRGQGLDLLLDALRDVLAHRGPARHHDVAVQVLPDVHVALHDRSERQLVDALLLQAQELRLEQRLRTH